MFANLFSLYRNLVPSAYLCANSVCVERSAVLGAPPPPAQARLAAQRIYFGGSSTPRATQERRSMRQRLPDMVLLDIQMPGMSGFEVCSEIRRGRTGALASGDSVVP